MAEWHEEEGDKYLDFVEVSGKEAFETLKELREIVGSSGPMMYSR